MNAKKDEESKPLLKFLDIICKVNISKYLRKSLKKQLILWMILVFLATGCAPKIGKIYALNEVQSKSTVEVSIIRNYNYAGSAVRLYPTLNNKKVAGLYSNDYIKFYLKEGSYKFGLMFPDVIFGRWTEENSIQKKIELNKSYYFLLSPTFLGRMEIEEITEIDAKERISSSKLIKTGTLSTDPGMVVKAIRPLGKLMGLDENDESFKYSQ